MYWSLNELSLWSLLLLIPRPVSGKTPWLTSSEFTKLYGAYQLTWANKTATNCDALLNHFIATSASRCHHDGTVKTKGFVRKFVCSDGSLATLIARDGVVHDLRRIRQKEPVTLAKVGAHAISVRAKLTVAPPLTITYIYALNVESKSGKTAKYNGAISYSINETTVILQILFNLGVVCHMKIHRPFFLTDDDGYKFNITGLEEVGYENDLQEQCSIHFDMFIANQIEIYYHSLFKSTETGSVLSNIVHNAFCNYSERIINDTRRKMINQTRNIKKIFNVNGGLKRFKIAGKEYTVRAVKHVKKLTDRYHWLTNSSSFIEQQSSLQEPRCHAFWSSVASKKHQTSTLVESFIELQNRSTPSSSSLIEQQNRTQSVRTSSFLKEHQSDTPFMKSSTPLVQPQNPSTSVSSFGSLEKQQNRVRSAWSSSSLEEAKSRIRPISFSDSLESVGYSFESELTSSMREQQTRYKQNSFILS